MNIFRFALPSYKDRSDYRDVFGKASKEAVRWLFVLLLISSG